MHALTVKTIELDVKIKEGHFSAIVGDMSISSISGNIETPKPSSNEDDVPYTLECNLQNFATVIGDITGWYPLYGSLKMETDVGDVDIDLGPKPLYGKPVPADLQITSCSGHVKVREPFSHAITSDRPDKEFPPRDYYVEITTTSGNIAADVAVSHLGSFISQSGDLNLNLWPVLDSSLLKSATKKLLVMTDTKSGNTHVNLLEPLWTSIPVGETLPVLSPLPPTPPLPPTDGKDKDRVVIYDADSDSISTNMFRSPATLSVLKSKHTSVSGDVTLFYPWLWQGILFAETISGRQNIRGDGLEVTRSGSDYYRHVTGKKCKGFSELTIETVSGDQSVWIGKKEAEHQN